jgi:ferredoxin
MIGRHEGEAHGIEAAVDRDLCVGSGPCFMVAPKAFQLDENMKAIVMDTSLESSDALMEAARSCPTQAIFLSIGGRALYPDK